MIAVGRDLFAALLRECDDILDRYESGNPLQAGELARVLSALRTQLEAQRGGVVVVPELTDSMVDLAIGPTLAAIDSPGASIRSAKRNGYRYGWRDACSSMKAIPTAQVLADGMVGVDREEWEVTSALALRLANWYNGHEINRTIWPPELQRYRAIDALRAQQAKGE